MIKPKNLLGQVKFNYLTGRDRYFLITDNSGYSSAEFRYRTGRGVVVTENKNRPVEP